MGRGEKGREGKRSVNLGGLVDWWIGGLVNGYEGGNTEGGYEGRIQRGSHVRQMEETN